MSIKNTLDHMFKLRATKRELETRLKEINKQFKDLENSAINQLMEVEMEATRVELGTATITKHLKPSVVDWPEFYSYIYQTKQIHLLERRPSVNAYRELREQGIDVPGVDDFTLISLNLRKK